MQAEQSARIGRGVLVFGAVGLVWAAQLASLLRLGCFDHDDALVLFALPIALPCAMAFVGAGAARIAVHPRRATRILAMAVLVPAVGMVTGLVSGLVWWPEAIGEATADGLAFGAVAWALVMPLTRALGRARPGSLLDGAERLAIWVRAGAVASLASVLTLPRWKLYAACDSEPTQAIIATAGAAVVVVLAASALVAHALAARRLLAEPPRFLDVGVGDGSIETMAPQPTAYRHPSEIVSVVHGDAAFGMQALRDHALSAGVYATLALVAASVGIALRV